MLKYKWTDNNVVQRCFWPSQHWFTSYT